MEGIEHGVREKPMKYIFLGISRWLAGFKVCKDICGQPVLCRLTTGVGKETDIDVLLRYQSHRVSIKKSYSKQIFTTTFIYDMVRNFRVINKLLHYSAITLIYFNIYYLKIVLNFRKIIFYKCTNE